MTAASPPTSTSTSSSSSSSDDDDEKKDDCSCRPPLSSSLSLCTQQQQQHHQQQQESSEHNKNWLQTLIQRHNNNTNAPNDNNNNKITRRTSPPDLLSNRYALCVAPMVDQSDLPFRLLCRRYGANLAVTPMIHCKMFRTSGSYARRMFDCVRGTPDCDRPLLAQLCGSDLDHVLNTALQLQPHVDGIDLNCGCPQNIAKKGNYGAFLLEGNNRNVLLELVRELSSRLDVPLSVKVRMLVVSDDTNNTNNSVEESVRFYQQLERAGASMITVHGRTRLQKGVNTGRADWECIRRAVELLKIPVLANGSMRNLDDVRECLRYTGAAGVMVSEALLEYPALFTETNVKSTDYARVGPGRLQLAQEYLDLARRYPPERGGQGRGVRCLRMHLHRILHADLQRHTTIRTDVVDAQTVEDLQNAVNEIRRIHAETNHNVAEEQLSWYVRHTTKHLENEFKIEQERARRAAAVVVEDDDDDEEEDNEKLPTPAECGMTRLFGENDGDDDGDY